EVGEDARGAVAAGKDVVAGDGLDDAGGAGLRAVGIVRGRGEAVRAGRDVRRRRRGRGQDVTAAATTAGAVAFAGAAGRSLLEPGTAAVAARAAVAAVAAAAAAAVVAVGRRVAIRRAAAGVARRPSGVAAVDVAFHTGVERHIHARRADGGAALVDIALRAGDALTLGAVRGVRGQRAEIGIDAGSRPGEYPAAASSETLAVDRDRRAAERDRAADVDGQHAARGTVPRQRRQRRAERRCRVLRNADDLERPLSL